jgi:hypothetical protein
LSWSFGGSLCVVFVWLISVPPERGHAHTGRRESARSRRQWFAFSEGKEKRRSNAAWSAWRRCMMRGLSSAEFQLT